uniref:Major facilitator superfamily (MFS) profile domain-containing protein n=1 Tax=Helicotheca tamesis TaxID=374047 RepID=A0A7S2GUV2_9STRA|mmetsp:Transcript_12061/g.16671  ORF Transcript_12061/g.16671 Transcript_12061/m.16671 type:complete len:575 (+) Transcript_12061:59-1783(+)
MTAIEDGTAGDAISYEAIPKNDITTTQSMTTTTNSEANKQKLGERMALFSNKVRKHGSLSSSSVRFPRIEMKDLDGSDEGKQEQQEQKKESYQKDEQSSSVSHKEIISVDEAIEKIGTGPFQFMVLIAAGLCFSADSMEIMLLSFLSIILREQWDLSSTETASITACVFAGALVGTLVLGPLGDRIGRRPVLLISCFFISFFGITTAFSQSFVVLLINRFWVGFGVGGLTVPFDILAELLPTSARGKNLAEIEFFWTAGSMAVPLAAYMTIGSGGSWQVFVLLCTIPCLASALISLFYVPESPRWLISCGRDEEAMEVLKAAAKMNGKDPGVLFPKGTILEDETEERSRFFDLFKPKWRNLTLNLWGVWAGFAIGYYGTVIVVTQVFDEVSDKQLPDTAEDHVNFDYSAIFVSSCSEIVGTVLMIFLVDRIGRVPLQILSFVMGGICLIALCFFASSENRSLVVFIAFVARVFEMAGSSTAFIAAAEVLSTEIRTTGHSAANAVARVGGFISPYLVGGGLSLRAVGLIMLLIHALTAICASRLPETKGVSLDHRDGVDSEPSTADESGGLMEIM